MNWEESMSLSVYNESKKKLKNQKNSNQMTYQLKNGRSLIVSESKPNYQLVDGKNITPIQWGDAMHQLQKNR